MKLSVVMPAYNEAGNISSAIREHITQLSALGLEDWELICLDDRSTDETYEIVSRLAEGEPRLRVLRHDVNQGIARSFDDLYKAATGTHVYMTASDGQWPAANIEPLLGAIESGADLAIGWRRNRREVYGPKRRVVSMLFNGLAFLLFGVRTRDAGSVKLGVREIFQYPVLSTSPFMEAERIIRAHDAGKQIVFVPITFRRRSTGIESGARASLLARSLRDCLRCFAAYRLRRR